MRKLLIAMGLVAMALPSQAATISSVASGEAGTYEDALANALRHAVEQVVGMSIGSSTYVSNLKTIQDKVYTAASGYIDSYDIVDKTSVGGGIRVTVSAQVSKEKLSSAVMPIVGEIVTLDGKLALANLNVDMGNQRSIERTFKGFLDELLGPALKVSFKGMRPVASTSNPDYITMYFDGLTVDFDEDWYQRYRAFHKSILGKSFTKDVFSHANSYGSREPHEVKLVADLLDANGEVIVTRQIQGTSCVTSWDRANGAELFSDGRALPVIPPTLERGQEHSVDVTSQVLKRVASVRVHQPEWQKWPGQIE